MFPAPVNAIVGIVPARVMSYPLAVRMHVRSVRVPFLIAKIAVFLGCLGCCLGCCLVFATRRGGTMWRNVPSPGIFPFAPFFFLRKSWNR